MAPNESFASAKSYFDYVSAGLLAEILSKYGSDSSDTALMTECAGRFFHAFRLTDVILFQKCGNNTRGDGNRSLTFFDSASSNHSSFECAGDVRYYRGAEIEADNENVLYSLIRKERLAADFLTVRSADEKVIRAAADSPEVDAVIPVSNSSQKPSAGQINHIVAKIAAGKQTAFAFDMAPFLFVKGYRRSKLFADAADMIPVLRRYNVPILLFSGAGTVFEQRGPYELEAFGQLLGLTQEETTAAVARLPCEILRAEQKQKAGLRVMAGVEIEEDVE